MCRSHQATKGREPIRWGWACALLLAGLMLSAAVVAAQTEWPAWPGSTPINLSQSEEDHARRPAVATGPGGLVLVVWWDQPEGEQGTLYARVSEDGGRTWGQSEVITATTAQLSLPHALIVDNRPLVAWAQWQRLENSLGVFELGVFEAERTGAGAWDIRKIADGTSDKPSYPRLVAIGTRLYAVFNLGESGTAPHDLRYAWRWFTDTTWTTPTVAHAHSSPGAMLGSLYPAAAAGSDGRVHVAWQETFASKNRSILYMSGTLTTAGSVEWSPPVTLSKGITVSVHPDLCVDPAGVVHVVWGEEEQDHYFPRYIHFDASGGGWITSTRIVTAKMYINSIDPAELAPHVACGQGEICAAWHGYREDMPSKAEEIWIRCSSDRGQTWSAPWNVSRSDAVVSIMPWIAFDDEGRGHVVWEERAKSGEKLYEVYYSGELYQVFLPLVLRNGS